MKSDAEADVATISFEGIEDHSLAIFLRHNWGLAIHIRNKMKIKCTVGDLLWYAIEAYSRGQNTYDETRNRKKGNTKSKYSFNHHWAQELKSILIGEKKRNMCEVSYEELLETNPAVLSKDRVTIDRETPHQEKLAAILKIAKSQRMAENIAYLNRHGHKVGEIAAELKLPAEKVETVISLMELIRNAK